MKKAFVLYLTFVLMLSTFLPVLSGAENNETVKNETPLSSNTADAPENLLPQSNEARRPDNTAATTAPAADKQ